MLVELLELIQERIENMQEINHVAMYLRISQEKKGENVETLANHRTLLTDFAKEKGYTYEPFEEVLSGGASEIEERPKLQEVLDRIEEFDAILVVELSRLSRNGYISELVLKTCTEYDKPIVTPVHIYDLANNNNDVLTFRFGSLIASQEHALIGKRSKSNKITMAKQGLHISGNVPFGYTRNPKTKKLEINEDEAPTIRYIFKLHAEGKGAFKIRDILVAEGYKSATGKTFNLPSVKRIIRNEAYKGWTVFNDRKKVKKNGKWTYEILDTIICKDAHPPIIPPDEWDSANQDRVERAERFRITREKPAIKTGVTMLKDLIFCGCCGCKMSIRKDNKLKEVYNIKKCEYLPSSTGVKCSNTGIRVDVVEDAVLKAVKKYKEQLEDVLASLDADDTSSVKAEQEHKLNQLDKRLKEVQAQQKELINLALSGIFSHDELKEKKQELTDLQKHLEAQHEKALYEMESVNVEEMKVQVEAVLKVIEKLEQVQDAEAKNEYLKRIIKKIHYKRVLPEHIQKLYTRHPERLAYKPTIEIEYY